MKNLFISVSLFLCAHYSIGQTTRQIDLVRAYLEKTGSSVIKNIAHPSCSLLSYQYFHNSSSESHVYFITLNYKEGGGNQREFSCKYQIDFNLKGYINSITSFNCGSPDFPCWAGCTFGGIPSLVTSESEKERLELYLHKDFSDIKCREFCAAKLFFKWYDLHYFDSY